MKGSLKSLLLVSGVTLVIFLSTFMLITRSFLVEKPYEVEKVAEKINDQSVAEEQDSSEGSQSTPPSDESSEGTDITDAQKSGVKKTELSAPAIQKQEVAKGSVSTPSTGAITTPIAKPAFQNTLENQKTADLKSPTRALKKKVIVGEQDRVFWKKFKKRVGLKADAKALLTVSNPSVKSHKALSKTNNASKTTTKTTTPSAPSIVFQQVQKMGIVKNEKEILAKKGKHLTTEDLELLEAEKLLKNLGLSDNGYGALNEKATQLVPAQKSAGTAADSKLAVESSELKSDFLQDDYEDTTGENYAYSPDMPVREALHSYQNTARERIRQAKDEIIQEHVARMALKGKVLPKEEIVALNQGLTSKDVVVLDKLSQPQIDHVLTHPSFKALLIQNAEYRRELEKKVAQSAPQHRLEIPHHTGEFVDNKTAGKEKPGFISKIKQYWGSKSKSQNKKAVAKGPTCSNLPQEPTDNQMARCQIEFAERLLQEHITLLKAHSFARTWNLAQTGGRSQGAGLVKDSQDSIDVKLDQYNDLGYQKVNPPAHEPKLDLYDMSVSDLFFEKGGAEAE